MGKNSKKMVVAKNPFFFFSKFNLGTTNFKLLLDAISNVLKKKKIYSHLLITDTFNSLVFFSAKLEPKLSFWFFL